MNPFCRGLTFAVPMAVVLWIGIIWVGLSCVGCVQPGSVAVKASLIDKDGAQWLQHEIGKVGDRLWLKLQEESNNRAAQVKAAASVTSAAASDAAAQAVAAQQAAAAAKRQADQNFYAALIAAGVAAFGAYKAHKATVSP